MSVLLGNSEMRLGIANLTRVGSSNTIAKSRRVVVESMSGGSSLARDN